MDDQAVEWSEERGRGSPTGEWHHSGRCILSSTLCLDVRSPIKTIKNRVGDQAEILYYMDDLKASVTSIDNAQAVHLIVKRDSQSVGMAINHKKSAIQLNVDTPTPRVSPGHPRD